MPDDDEGSAPDPEEVAEAAEAEFLEAEADAVTLSDAERQALELEKDRRSGPVPDEVS
jgi:hypothetical protein